MRFSLKLFLGNLTKLLQWMSRPGTIKAQLKQSPPTISPLNRFLLCLFKANAHFLIGVILRKTFSLSKSHSASVPTYTNCFNVCKYTWSCVLLLFAQLKYADKRVNWKYAWLITAGQSKTRLKKTEGTYRLELCFTTKLLNNELQKERCKVVWFYCSIWGWR